MRGGDTDWNSAEGARKGHDLRSDQAEAVRDGELGTRDREPRRDSSEILSIEEREDGRMVATVRLVVHGLGMVLESAEYRLSIIEGGTYKNVLTGNILTVPSIEGDGSVSVGYRGDIPISDEDSPSVASDIGLIESADEDTPDPVIEKKPAPWDEERDHGE